MITRRGEAQSRKEIQTLADSNYFYTEESIPCTNFCVCIMLFAFMLHTQW